MQGYFRAMDRRAEEFRASQFRADGLELMSELLTPSPMDLILVSGFPLPRKSMLAEAAARMPLAALGVAAVTAAATNPLAAATIRSQGLEHYAVSCAIDDRNTEEAIRTEIEQAANYAAYEFVKNLGQRDPLIIEGAVTEIKYAAKKLKNLDPGVISLKEYPTLTNGETLELELVLEIGH